MTNNATILISDDSVDLVSALTRLARRAGLRVIQDTAGDVVRLAQEERPDVILLDIHQAGRDGRNLLAELKAQDTTAGIEVLVMSGRNDPWTRNECILLGALEFIPKPLPDGLMEEVRLLAQQVRGAQPSPARQGQA